MKNNKKIYGTMIFSVVAILSGIILALPENFGICSKNDVVCIDSYIYKYNTLATLLIIFSVPLLFISLICVFLRDQIFNIWIKFAIIFVPIAVVFTMLIARGSRGTLVSISEESGSLFFAGIFIVASLLIIAIKSFRLRGEKK